jgi:hypothetical protein
MRFASEPDAYTYKSLIAYLEFRLKQIENNQEMKPRQVDLAESGGLESVCQTRTWFAHSTTKSAWLR